MAFKNINSVFNISSEDEFKKTAMTVFSYQYHNNKIYKLFCDSLKRNPSNVNSIENIPFIPISAFKHNKLIADEYKPEHIFESSGTTGINTSKHYIADLNIYEKSFTKCFRMFYNNETEYSILALLPSYLERKNSSLVYMVSHLIKNGKNPHSGFFLNNLEELSNKLRFLSEYSHNILLIGVSFALIELSKKHPVSIPNATIIETGGMKGRGKEIIREELHSILCNSFGTEKIHSEYGMTELLSQAYSSGKGIFHCPPWMKVYIRDMNDPLSNKKQGNTGGINIVDLANIYSCSFIATDDLGKVHPDNSFEITGRFDSSDTRGCNLLVFN